MSAGLVILVLKVAVVAVTALLAASLVALARGQYLLHGRINTVFFILTLAALVGLEMVARLVNPALFDDFFTRHDKKQALWTHLAFSMPAAFLLLVMLATGKKHWRRFHIVVGLLFLVVWTGTVITGVFFLPHWEP